MIEQVNKAFADKAAVFSRGLVKKILPVAVAASLCAGGTAYSSSSFHTHEQTELLVNTDNPLTEQYTPPNLVEISYYKIPAAVSKLKMQDEAAYYLSAMMAGMQKSGIKNVKVLRAYEKGDGKNVLYSKKNQNYVTAADCDEHQTGLCADLATGKTTDKKFRQSSAYSWLTQNSHKYGFILRYPEDKTDVTNHEYEPWHYRYVGIPMAMYLKEYNMCLEEFYKHTPPPFWDEPDEKIKTYLYAMYDKINIMHGDNSFRGGEKISFRELYKWLDEYYGYKAENSGSSIADLKSKLYCKALIFGNKISLAEAEAQNTADSSINREQLVLSMSHLLDSYEKTSDFEFADIPPENERLRKAANKMYNMGIIRGFGDKTFHPQSAATKTEALVLIYDILRLL